MELKVAIVEGELEDLKILAKRAADSEEKENLNRNSSRVSTDKELSKKLKKLSRTMSSK